MSIMKNLSLMATFVGAAGATAGFADGKNLLAFTCAVGTYASFATYSRLRHQEANESSDSNTNAPQPS